MRTKTVYKRNTIFDLFILLGGFISMITRLTNFVIRGYQGYAIDKSLVKKVFSRRIPKNDGTRKGNTMSRIETSMVSRGSMPINKNLDS